VNDGIMRWDLYCYGVASRDVLIIHIDEDEENAVRAIRPIE
jgi:hypothetical protein